MPTLPAGAWMGAHLAAFDAVVRVQARRVVEAEVQGRLGAGHQGAAVQTDRALQEGGLHGGGGLPVAVAVGRGQGVPAEAGLVERRGAGGWRVTVLGVGRPSRTLCGERDTYLVVMDLHTGRPPSPLC